ncbi:bifunctional adenosylcobinamide kinase/adenosylcobinamide-phosphate guanylyltransferase [Micromonospora sp. NPDC000207]|uniref:bifunctional adenosylcobinamide kinase/adenosylcobinamide-phosphate guanylyltransferase n=1 Tax=Micromonospora sp. NPDC000207 TaxID=3154246 RepID=UPI00331A3FB8
MSVDGWNKVLVLGGVRSGKSEFAESLIGDAATVRYLATSAPGDPEDTEWAQRLAAHRTRRPGSWRTEETADEPRRLADVLTAAEPSETLIVDDLGGWVTVLLDPAHQPADDTATIAELAAAIRSCPARVVLVSPEVGLSLVATTPIGRAFTDALGSTNRAVADVCDTVVLVVAGQPCRLKPTTAPVTQSPAVAAQTGAATPSPAPVVDGLPVTPAVTAAPEPVTPAPAAAPVRSVPSWAGTTQSLPTVTPGPVIGSGLDLPMPDEDAGPQAVARLSTLDVPGTGLGVLERVVEFAAATQGTPAPAPWNEIRLILLNGDHDGASSAGAVPGDAARRAQQAEEGTGVLGRLAAQSGVALQVVDVPPAAPIEEGPALTAETVDAALRFGWQLAQEAAEAGVQLLVLGACGAGTDTAAAAVLGATAGAEPPVVLNRVLTAEGTIDDGAWMRRCAAVRDALHRTRRTTREAKEVLADLGGGDIAVATGILLGAAAHRVPVLLDGPVGLAAGMVSRDLAGQARHWCLLADVGGHPAVRLAADILGLVPLLDLRLGLGEGANALTALPLLRSVLALAADLSTDHLDDDGQPDTDGQAGGDRPDTDAPKPDTDTDEPTFAEPEPAGPGPATTEPTTTTPPTTEPTGSEPTAPPQPSPAATPPGAAEPTAPPQPSPGVTAPGAAGADVAVPGTPGRAG